MHILNTPPSKCHPPISKTNKNEEIANITNITPWLKSGIARVHAYASSGCLVI